MRKPDGLYFTQGQRFRDIDFDDQLALSKALRSRIDIFFIKPAQKLVDCNDVFACGLIVIATIDAIAEYMEKTDDSYRFAEWLEKYIPEFREIDTSRDGKKTLADTCYDFFRNGLIHHGRISRGGQISLEIQGCFQVIGKTYILNPKNLLDQLETIFNEFIEKLAEDKTLFLCTAKFMKRVFKEDIENDRNWN